MKVSVIVPFWNLENYVDRCLDSITNQTYKDLEILVVDNASEDKTVEKLKRWCEKDDRIILIQLDSNEGPAGARNTALDRATGEYICCVDGDDCVAPLYVQNLMQMIEEYGTKIALCGYGVITPDTKLAEIPATLQMYYPEIIDQKDYFYRINTDKEIVYVVPWGKLYHKSLFEGVRYADMLNEDEEIIHKLIDRVDRIPVSYEPLYFYTSRVGSVMKSAFSDRYMGIFPAYQDRIDYFNEKGWYDLSFRTMRKYMARALELYSNITPDIENGEDYKKLLLDMLSRMIKQALKCPVKSRRFMLKVIKYRLFPSSYKSGDSNKLLFG